jgi:hypothetical protein
MSAHQDSILAPGPDLLARYLNVYLHAKPARSFDNLWGLGGEELDGLWLRLFDALSEGPRNLNRVVAEELGAAEKARIAETLTPLIFALPLRSYPAELRVAKAGPWMILTLRDLSAAPSPLNPCHCAKGGESISLGREHVGYLPAALAPALAGYVRRVLRWPASRRGGTVAISSGFRRRRVRVTLLARERGMVIRFLKQLPPPADE